eukprot:3806160-Pleurochrysis_carterae.AAC.3
MGSHDRHDDIGRLPGQPSVDLLRRPRSWPPAPGATMVCDHPLLSYTVEAAVIRLSSQPTTRARLAKPVARHAGGCAGYQSRLWAGGA